LFTHLKDNHHGTLPKGTLPKGTLPKGALPKLRCERNILHFSKITESINKSVGYHTFLIAK